MTPELVVKLRPAAVTAAPMTGGLQVLAVQPAMLGLHDMLVKEGLAMRPVRRRLTKPAALAFAGGEAERPKERLDAYWTVQGDQEQLEGLRARMADLPGVEAAFLAPPPEVMNLTVFPAAAAPPVTPDFRTRQGYLDAAPGGIDATHAWSQPGGRGQGVRIIDIEGDWILDHEDLSGRISAALILGADPNANWQGTRDSFLQHGTAVLGELIAADNGFGVTGIATGAEVGVVSHMHAEQGGRASGPATAIANATDLLRAGDVMLLEMHMPGPRYGFASMDTQLGYIAVEWWEHIFDAVKDATDRGILVVEAAGNGRENLDDPLYDTSAPGFSRAWRNPFRRQAESLADSGAVIVGAGAPPSGAFGPDRSRLDFSNYGSTVDAQGWGREVVTTGYGDLQTGQQTRWYTAQFAGTFSASPMIAGALACVQGVLRAQGMALLTPAEARDLLRRTGSPQQWPAGTPSGSERIGNRPDLKALIAEALARPVA